MVLAARLIVPGFPTELVFDHVQQLPSKLAKARDYIDSCPVSRQQCERVVAIPLPEKITARELPAMQAADLLVAEFRQHHERVSEWFDTRREAFPDIERGWEDLQEWILAKYGTFERSVRKSAVA